LSYSNGPPARGPLDARDVAMSERILIIDDDEGLAAMVAEYLGKTGHTVTTASTAAAGFAQLRQTDFAALILDVMLPDGDGFDICRQLRAESDIPILMLTARGEPTDRIVGLELGADDYLPKPFDPRELLARLRAILRRRQAAAQPENQLLRFGHLLIDRDARVVQVDGETRPLTSHQFDLLCALAENAGRVMSRDALMNSLRGQDIEAFDRSIDVHISRLRTVLEKDPKKPRRILTVRGSGYVFARNPDEESG
jgi:two-component system phosphate regulon response regulator OmpR